MPSPLLWLVQVAHSVHLSLGKCLLVPATCGENQAILSLNEGACILVGRKPENSPEGCVRCCRCRGQKYGREGRGLQGSRFG